MTITINHNNKFDYKPYFEKIDTRLYGIESNQGRILSLLNKIRMALETVQEKLDQLQITVDEKQAELEAALAGQQAANEALATANADLTTANATLQTTIDELNAIIATGTVTPEQVQAVVNKIGVIQADVASTPTA
jgi:chromosome segregation ATPase